MKAYINNILKSQKKESLFVFVLFLLFFPLKTQTHNSLNYIFDQIFTSGIASKIFTYNYLGIFLGCEEVSEFEKHYIEFNFFQRHGFFFFNYLFSIITFYFLFKRWKRNIYFSKADWILTLLTCFGILNTLENIFNLKSMSILRNEIIIYYVITILIFIPIGIFIFLKIFTIKERTQTIIIGLPAVILSMIIWYRYLGPILLPI